MLMRREGATIAEIVEATGCSRTRSDILRRKSAQSTSFSPSRCAMKRGMRVSWCLSLLLLMPPAAGSAQEPPSVRKASDLAIKATIPVPGDTMAFSDIMAFGFEAIWLASGVSVVRVDPGDHSVIEIALEGASGPSATRLRVRERCGLRASAPTGFTASIPLRTP